MKNNLKANWWKGANRSCNVFLCARPSFQSLSLLLAQGVVVDGKSWVVGWMLRKVDSDGVYVCVVRPRSHSQVS